VKAVCVFLLPIARGACGRSRRPAFPAPSVQQRANEDAKLGQIVSRE
jgi:hypothetical protein